MDIQLLSWTNRKWIQMKENGVANPKKTFQK